MSVNCERVNGMRAEILGYENHMMENYKKEYVITKEKSGMTSIQGKKATITPYDIKGDKYMLTVGVDGHTKSARDKFFKLVRQLERKFKTLNIPVIWEGEGVGVFNKKHIHTILLLIGAKVKKRNLQKEIREQIFSALEAFRR